MSFYLKNGGDFMNTIEIINDLLKEKGISASKMMKDLGFSSGLFSQWKKGLQNPSRKKLEMIAQYFNVSVDYLLGTPQIIQVYDENDNVVVIDDETRDIIDSLRTNPEMKILFSVTKKATKEDIIKAVKIIEALKDDEG